MIHKNLIKALLKSLIFYKKAISPYVSGQCNFSITCSEYAQKTISSKGIIKGLFLSITRIIICSLYPIIKKFNLSNKKISLKVFLFFSLLFIICISCTNFSPQGGWSNVVKDTNQEEYYVISDEGRLFQIQFNDQIPMINWSYPEEENGTSYSTPIIRQNSVIGATYKCKGQTCTGDIFELDKLSGDVLWKKTIPSKINSNLIIINDTLFVASLNNEKEDKINNASIYIISLKKGAIGEIIGKIPIEGEIWTGVHSYGEKNVIVGTMKGMIYSYNVDELLSVKDKKYSEALIFSHKFPHAINSPLNVHNKRLFFADIAGNFYSINLEDFKNNQLDKMKILTTNEWIINNPIFLNDEVYLFTLNGDIYVVDFDTNEVKDKFSIDEIVVGDPILLSDASDQEFLIPTEKNGIEIVSNNGFEKGSSLGNYPTDKKLYSAPLINDRTLLIHTEDGEILFFNIKSRDLIYCLDLNKGSVCD